MSDGPSTKSDGVEGGESIPSFEGYSDADLQRTMWSALRLVGIAAAVGIPLLWWKRGWQSAAMFAVGAAISGSGLFEWVRLMTAVMARMDAGATARPLAGVLIGFFLRLGIALVLLYGSLKFLGGSGRGPVWALVAGLALGVAALSIQGLRVIKSWTL